MTTSIEQDVVSPEPKVFVGQVPASCTRELMTELMSKHGEVKAVTLPQKNDGTEARRFAMVAFSCWAEAEAAVEALHATTALGGDRPLVVRYADPPKGEDANGISPKKLFVGQVRAACSQCRPSCEIPLQSLSAFLRLKRPNPLLDQFVYYILTAYILCIWYIGHNCFISQITGYHLSDFRSLRRYQKSARNRRCAAGLNLTAKSHTCLSSGLLQPVRQWQYSPLPIALLHASFAIPFFKLTQNMKFCSSNVRGKSRVNIDVRWNVIMRVFMLHLSTTGQAGQLHCLQQTRRR
jgi:RNA recognition motif-containing protein